MAYLPLGKFENFGITNQRISDVFRGYRNRTLGKMVKSDYKDHERFCLKTIELDHLS